MGSIDHFIFLRWQRAIKDWKIGLMRSSTVIAKNYILKSIKKRLYSEPPNLPTFWIVLIESGTLPTQAQPPIDEGIDALRFDNRFSPSPGENLSGIRWQSRQN